MKSKKSNKTVLFNYILIVGIPAFIILAFFASRSSYFVFDLSLSRTLQNIHHPVFSLFMNLVSDLGDDYHLEAVVVLAMSLLYFAGLKSEAVKTALLTIAGATAGTLTKSLISRPRPDAELVTIQETLHDKSFPSLHVLIFTVFFGYILYLALYKVRTPWLKILIAIPSLLLLLSIGMSRIYLGAHWASDTLGGYLLGGIFLSIAIKIGGQSSKKTK